MEDGEFVNSKICQFGNEGETERLKVTVFGRIAMKG